jgi:2-keto-3-deoxy-L-rhamnonate aldolase RhmA
MRSSKTLKTIRTGGLARCANLGSFNPSYVAHAARAGFDCIWLDLEHRAMELHELQTLLAHFRIYDIDCLLRAPTLEKTALYRYLEEGATGLMIPHVSTAEKARQLVQAVKFPPLGDRGLDNAGFFLVVQIETPEAVENVEEIAGVPGVDMLFVGPGDLGLRYQIEGDPDGERLEAAYERVAAACKAHGVAWGCPSGPPEEMRRRRDQGAGLLCNCGDFMILKHGLLAASAEFDQIE